MVALRRTYTLNGHILRGKWPPFGGRIGPTPVRIFSILTAGRKTRFFFRENVTSLKFAHFFGSGSSSSVQNCPWWIFLLRGKSVSLEMRDSLLGRSFFESRAYCCWCCSLPSPRRRNGPTLTQHRSALAHRQAMAIIGRIPVCRREENPSTKFRSQFSGNFTTERTPGTGLKRSGMSPRAD